MDGRLVTFECRIVSSQLLTLKKRFGTLVERRHNVEPIRMNPTHSFQPSAYCDNARSHCMTDKTDLRPTGTSPATHPPRAPHDLCSGTTNSAYIAEGFGAGSSVVAYVGDLGGQIGFVVACGIFTSSTLDNLFDISIPISTGALMVAVLVTAVGYSRVDISEKVRLALGMGTMAGLSTVHNLWFATPLLAAFVVGALRCVGVRNHSIEVLSV